MSEENGSVKKFRTKLAREPIVLEGKGEGGTDLECYLEELEADKKDDWVNETLARNKYNESGVRVGYDVKNLEIKMVHLCLYKLDGTKFSFREIQGLPSSTVKALYGICEDLNGISEKARTAIKNG